MTDRSGPTPTLWRVAALAALGGGLILGDRAAGGGRARLAALAICGVVGVAVPPIFRAGRRGGGDEQLGARANGLAVGESRPSDEVATYRASVIVAARDEVQVIGALVADFAAQDLRDASGRLDAELIVIDDRSVDGTGAAARGAAVAAGIGDRLRIVRREGPGLGDGKGAALGAVPPDQCLGTLIVVLDADARFGPGFLAALARRRASGLRAMTARRRTLHEDKSWLSGAQADEQAVDGAIQSGRWALGGMSEFRGNGMVIDRDLLIEAGGWRPDLLTEDLDLSSRIAVTAGERVALIADADVWELPVRTWSGLWRQRLRWAEGSIRRFLEHTPAVLRSERLSVTARLDFVAYGGQLVSPPVIVGALVGSVRRRRPGIAVALIGTYAAASGALAFRALEGERGADGRVLTARRRAQRGGRMAAFSTLWLAVVPGALWRLGTRRGPIHFDKMEHLAPSDASVAGATNGVAPRRTSAAVLAETSV